MFTSTGTVEYDPRARIKFEPWWCILRTDPAIVAYYQHQLKQRYDLHFDNTIWGSHISVVRGIQPSNKVSWKKYQGKRIQFQYNNLLYRKGLFFCVDAYCKELNDIQLELGLPTTRFHITIARINKPYINLKIQKLNDLFEKMGVPHISKNHNLLPLITI